jgi:hypothetical protein
MIKFGDMTFCDLDDWRVHVAIQMVYFSFSWLVCPLTSLRLTYLDVLGMLSLNLIVNGTVGTKYSVPTFWVHIWVAFGKVAVLMSRLKIKTPKDQIYSSTSFLDTSLVKISLMVRLL